MEGSTAHRRALFPTTIICFHTQNLASESTVMENGQEVGRRHGMAWTFAINKASRRFSMKGNKAVIQIFILGSSSIAVILKIANPSNFCP